MLTFDPNEYPYGKEPGANKFGLTVCPTCGAEPVETGDPRLPKAFLFKDKLSAQEYYISGMCQSCQDKVFNVDE